MFRDDGIYGRTGLTGTTDDTHCEPFSSLCFRQKPLQPHFTPSIPDRLTQPIFSAHQPFLHVHQRDITYPNSWHKVELPEHNPQASVFCPSANSCKYNCSPLDFNHGSSHVSGSKPRFISRVENDRESSIRIVRMKQLKQRARVR